MRSEPVMENAKQAHRRLEQLYEISKLLTRFESVERTIPEVTALVRQVLSLRTAIVTLEPAAYPEPIVWHAEDVDTQRLRRARNHARTSYAYLVRSGSAPSVGLEGASEGAPSEKDEPGRFIVLPLVVDHRAIFGAFQLEIEGFATKLDLMFANAVVNQLAVALDRYAKIRAEQAGVERGRIDAERRQASAEAATERYEALVDNLDHAFVWEADVETLRIGYVSARVEMLLGRPRQRWIADPDLWLRSIHPDDRAEVERMFRGVASGIGDRRCDHRCSAADGRVVWLHTGVHLARGDSGPRRLQGVSVDITPSKELEAELRGQLAFTRAVTDSLGEGVIAVDPDERVVFLNPAAEQRLGWREEEASGKPVDEILRVRRSDGAPLSSEDAPLRRAMTTGEPVRGDDLSFSHRNGPGFPVSHTAAPLRREGRGTGAVLVFKDITEVMRTERSSRFLGEATAKLNASLEEDAILEGLGSLTVPSIADVCFVDLLEDGKVRRLRPTVAERKAHVLGPYRDRHAISPEAWGPRAEVLRTGTPFFVEMLEGPAWEIAAPDPDYREILEALGARSLIIVPLAVRGHTFGTLTLISAESDRRHSSADLVLAEELAHRASMAIDNARLYHQAQRAIRSREDLLAIVSHDLRTPLSSISLSAQLISRNGGADSVELQRKTETIRRAVRQMNHLIGDLLQLASIDAGRLTIDRARWDASGLLEEAVEATVQLAQERSISLEAEPPPTELEVFCDRQRILQVFSNLVGNAIKFTPEGGAVRLRAERIGKDVRFSVSDTGPGISPAAVPHLFERYWQVKETKALGIGLGLAIAKGIVESHQGKIWVESALGHGTTFHFTLPLTQPADFHPVPSSPGAYV